MDKESLGAKLGKEISRVNNQRTGLFESGKTVQISEAELEELKAKAECKKTKSFF